jgi:hypothetical protein
VIYDGSKLVGRVIYDPARGLWTVLIVHDDGWHEDPLDTLLAGPDDLEAAERHGIGVVAEAIASWEAH